MHKVISRKKESVIMNNAMANKVFVLGVDGMDPRFASRMLREKKMPNLQKLVDRGAHRADLSMLGAHPTITPPMWTTLATGAFASTHGITCYNRQGEHINETAYNMDSRNCKAEQLWNVTAEAGKKTLVWHWPGSSWPPTSDSPNLYVVDGTNPGGVNVLANVDNEFLFVANVKTEEVIYKPRAASDSNIPCVVNDVKPSDLELKSSKGLKEILILKPEDGESLVSILPADVVMSPINPAKGWADAPADAMEFTMLLSQGLIRRVGLILKNENGIYDKVALYKSKKATEPIVVLEKNVFTKYIYDEAINDDKTYQVFRNMRVLELAEDGTNLKIWVSSAVDLSFDELFHPKSLYKTVVEHAGYPHPFSFMGGSDKVLIDDCTGANWGANAQWTADSLLYLMRNEGFEVVFSHFHNIDLQGHMIVKYLKPKNLPGQKLTEAEYNQLFENIYTQTDEYIGRFLPLLDEGWTILLVSDHGQVCPEHHHHELGDPCGVNVRVLQRLGYTAIKTDADGNEIYEIDWEHTKAVAVRANHIYLNIKGRDQYGIVDPADQYEVEEQLITDLYGYRDPETGKRVIALALRNRDAIQFGLNGPESGDIIYFAAEGYHLDHGECLSSTRGYDDTSVAPIFVAAGPGIKENFVTDRVIRQVDVTPTVAALLGVRMPHQCEGAPAYQIFTETY